MPRDTLRGGDLSGRGRARDGQLHRACGKRRRVVRIIAAIVGCILAAAFACGIDALALEQRRVDRDGVITGGSYDIDLPAEASDFLGTSNMDDLTLEGGIKLLTDGVAGSLGGLIRQATAPAAAVLLAAMLCGAAETMFPERERAMRVLPLVGTLAIAAAVCGDLFALVGSGRSVISAIDTFSKGLLATLAATGAAIGAPTGASARHAAAMLFSDAAITVTDRVLTPALYAYAAVCVADAAIGGEPLSGLAKFLRSAVVTMLSLMITAFLLYLTLSGAAAHGADALAVKATKTVIANAVPVVGGALADASETVIASTRMLRSATGVAGVIALAALTLPEFLRLGTRYLLLKVAGAISPLVCGGRLSKLIENLAGAFGILLGMVAATALTALVSTVSMITLVGAS